MKDLPTLYAQLSNNAPSIYYDTSTNTYLSEEGGYEMNPNEFEDVGNGYVRHKKSGQIYSVVPFD